MDNYQFCVSFAINRLEDSRGKALDFGCGRGRIVRMLRDARVDAFGCDIFYDGAAHRAELPEGYLGNIIRVMPEGRAPFDDGTFEVVVSNQVIEHVDNLSLAVTEVARVLKPGGVYLTLFPDKAVWREGHCGVPFVHWFPRGSKLRLPYTMALRALGVGYFKEGKPIRKWAQDALSWVDKWTHYRTEDEVLSVLNSHFKRIEHIEVFWLDQRFPYFRWLPSFMRRLIVRKLGGLVLVCHR